MSAPTSAAALRRSRLLETLATARFSAGDDHEVPIALVALPTGESDLVDEFPARRGLSLGPMVVRPLRKELILDMDASNTGADELANGAHRMQRVTEPSTAIRHGGNPHRIGDIAGDPHLFVHGVEAPTCSACCRSQNRPYTPP